MKSRRKLIAVDTPTHSSPRQQQASPKRGKEAHDLVIDDILSPGNDESFIEGAAAFNPRKILPFRNTLSAPVAPTTPDSIHETMANRRALLAKSNAAFVKTHTTGMLNAGRDNNTNTKAPFFGQSVATTKAISTNVVKSADAIADNIDVISLTNETTTRAAEEEAIRYEKQLSLLKLKMHEIELDLESRQRRQLEYEIKGNQMESQMRAMQERLSIATQDCTESRSQIAVFQRRAQGKNYAPLIDHALEAEMYAKASAHEKSQIDREREDYYAKWTDAQVCLMLQYFS
jgi:hypothetical protein